MSQAIETFSYTKKNTTLKTFLLFDINNILLLETITIKSSFKQLCQKKLCSTPQMWLPLGKPTIWLLNKRYVCIIRVCTCILFICVYLKILKSGKVSLYEVVNMEAAT